jgi:hypothetical protein
VTTARFLPNTFILGAAKCATTAIHSLLAGLSGACMSDPKEPFFFECEFDQGLDFYRSKYFGHWNGETVVGEARHRNLYLPYVAERIHAVNPGALLIASLRNPIERAYSHWWHWTSRGKEAASFDDAVAAELDVIASGGPSWDEERIRGYCDGLGRDGKGPYTSYVDSGHYAEQLERYFRLFSRDQMLVIQYDQLSRSPEHVERQIADFVGLDLGDIQLQTRNIRRGDPDRKPFPKLRPLGRVLPRAVRRPLSGAVDRITHAQISRPTRALLQQHYRPHNEALDELLGWDVSSRWR